VNGGGAWFCPVCGTDRAGEPDMEACYAACRARRTARARGHDEAWTARVRTRRGAAVEPDPGGRGRALVAATRDYGRRVRAIVGDRAERDRRAEKLLLDAALPLTSLCFRHSDPGSTVWVITTDHPTRWELWRPGSVDFTGPEPRRRAAGPAAWRPCDRGSVQDGFDPARATPRGEPPTLREIRLWARPWVEAVAGAPVVESAHGWTPEAPDGRSAYVVLLSLRPPERSRDDGRRREPAAGREPGPRHPAPAGTPLGAGTAPSGPVGRRGPCLVRASARCDGRGERVRDSWVCLPCLLESEVVGRSAG